MDKYLVALVLAAVMFYDFALGNPLPQGTRKPLIPSGPAVSGPTAPPAPFFTPEVSAAMAHFMQAYNKQALLAASFPDDPAAGQPLDSTVPQVPLFPTPAPAGAAAATSVQASFSARSGVAASSAAASAPPPIYTIPEAYAQYYALLAPSPAPPAVPVFG